MNRFTLALMMILATGALSAQPEGRPKLVVGIVVDQMRYDYLNRFWNHYGEGGLKRLVNDGFNCRNLHYNYGPTFTGPGHASIYTGTTPRYHGVIGNDWYDRERGSTRYCSEDRSVQSVGQSTPQGQMSPKPMLATTMTDELKLSTAGRSKVISVSMKDRGATLPGGHTGDAAYWMTDRWITSSHYRSELPQWVTDFNNSMDQYIPEVWETMKPIENYAESWPDDNEYEYTYAGKDRPVFPYDLKKLMPENGGINMIKSTPFGNTITTEFAKAALRNEQLGKGEVTDFLAVSYSSPDYLGHMFGPQAVEVQDNYLRFDAELAELLNFLDTEIGTGQYLVFLTADHGGGWVPAHLQDMKIPGGYLQGSLIANSAKEYLMQRYNLEDAVLSFSNEQFFLNTELIVANGHDVEQVSRSLADFVVKFEGVSEAYTRWDMQRTEFTDGMVALMQRGVHHQRSGEVILILENGWMQYGRRGTTHGSPYPVDTHVPALFYGWGVNPGYTDEKLSITDIAPTICSLLQISFPSALQGQPVRAITEH